MGIIISIPSLILKILLTLIYKMNILLKLLNFVYDIMTIVFILMNAGFPKIIIIGMKYSVDMNLNVMIQLL